MAPGKSEEGKQPGFKVSDRRSFSESGEPKPDAPPPEPTAPAADASAPVADAAANQPDAPPREPSGREYPPVDFHTFILSLGSSALLHLGELDHPDGHASKPDLALAKHTIDIIGMLQEKTKGNLSPPEERLIESLLYDLRLRYVEGSKAPTG
jgi:hypothetical protein